MERWNDGGMNRWLYPLRVSRAEFRVSSFNNPVFHDSSIPLFLVLRCTSVHQQAKGFYRTGIQQCL
jgi:hypothetical protein